MDGTAVSLITPARRRESSDAKRLLLDVGIAIVCALVLFLNVQMVWPAGKGGMDFNQFYAASRLAGTGHLYDWSALKALEAANGPPIHCGRLPIVAYGVRLISWMPFTLALRVWQTASVAALLIVCAAWPGVSRLGLLVALSWSAPAIFLLSLGQDVAFWLLFFGLGMALLERGYPRLAGVAFALCLCKYHLAIGIPIMLIAQKRWRTIMTGALAVLGLVGASFAVEGRSWPREYLRTVTNPDFSPAIRTMPNLHGLAAWSPGGVSILEFGAVTAVALLLWFACRRISSVGVAGAAAAACGLILGHHGYPQDVVLLIPLAVLTIGSAKSALWLRSWGAFVLTPICPMLLMMDRPFLGQVLLIGFVVLAVMGAVRSTSPEDSELRP
jgi:Glycosyltransferase family 87